MYSFIGNRFKCPRRFIEDYSYIRQYTQEHLCNWHLEKVFNKLAFLLDPLYPHDEVAEETIRSSCRHV